MLNPVFSACDKPLNTHSYYSSHLPDLEDKDNVLNVLNFKRKSVTQASLNVFPTVIARKGLMLPSRVTIKMQF